MFDAVDVPCPEHLHFSHTTSYVHDFCSLPDQDVGHYGLVCDVEHIYFHSGLCGSKFVLCFFGECPGLCTMMS